MSLNEIDLMIVKKLGGSGIMVLEHVLMEYKWMSLCSNAQRPSDSLTSLARNLTIGITYFVDIA